MAPLTPIPEGCCTVALLVLPIAEGSAQNLSIPKQWAISSDAFVGRPKRREQVSKSKTACNKCSGQNRRPGKQVFRHLPLTLNKMRANGRGGIARDKCPGDRGRHSFANACARPRASTLRCPALIQVIGTPMRRQLLHCDAGSCEPTRRTSTRGHRAAEAQPALSGISLGRPFPPHPC